MVFLIQPQNIIHISDDFIKGYVNFADFQPSTEKDQDCFVMRSADNYKWRTVNCDIQYPFICMLGELFMVHVKICCNISLLATCGCLILIGMLTGVGNISLLI